ncbi:ATP-binding protein [Streptomyces pilosus]|uniref:ATP-binding protein n=1 Tax=Streptomyces pilosus TaxID=28893 RepID=UPI0036FBFC77
MNLTFATPHTIGRPVYTTLLPCRPDSVRRARQFVSSVLTTWGTGTLVEDLELVVSELLTNVIDHTVCAMAQVMIERCPDGVVRIEVADNSYVQPRMQEGDAAAESGRGLFLVAALSWRWGCVEHDWGKSIWAELKTLGNATSAASQVPTSENVQ